MVTGFLVKYVGWRAAFVVPAFIAFACGALFAHAAPEEGVAPARRPVTNAMLPERALAHVFAMVTVASISGSMLYNFTTNGNGELLRERLQGIVDDPASLGMLLALVYVAGALAQVAVGLLLDRVPVKLLYAGIVAAQVPLFLFAAGASGWALYALMIAFMIAVFGAIPFTDALIVRHVDDSMRSRVSGMRLAVAFGVSSLAVWALGPLVKAAGFRSLLFLMAGTAAGDALCRADVAAVAERRARRTHGGRGLTAAWFPSDSDDGARAREASWSLIRRTPAAPGKLRDSSPSSSRPKPTSSACAS